MINFNYITDNQLFTESSYRKWTHLVVISEDCSYNELNFVFCDDEYLLKMNQEFLKHDTFTDIITFDYSAGTVLSGDIFISVERVKENSVLFNVSFEMELRRVMAHGVLHLAGYGDKSDEEILVMRSKEEEKMKLFHVEQ